MDNITFEKLSPTTEADVKVYKEALDFVFSNDDVRNVAISGAYGAGKSSILESYKQSCCNPESYTDKKQARKAKARKYIHISLAHFEENQSERKKRSQNDNTINNGISSEAMLEGKILNQLIHQIPSNNIPQTHFRVKKNIHWWEIPLYSFLTITFLLSIFHLIFYSFLTDCLPTLPESLSWMNFMVNSISRLISIGLIALIGILSTIKIIKIQANKSILKKLNFNGTEIEIFENSDESYFDKYLNEVLYLFERSEADVIVFEDIDRYDDVLIFERLREINTLVNVQAGRKNKEPLRFFYMLKDDIFASKDRTKFFDFIIPVVPVIDGSNAYNQFKTHLNNNGIYNEFDSNFLQGVARYVDEMRLLKNICNEFIVYFKRMANNVDLNYNKMFAMVIYKNLFPRDFCQLQLGRGFVAALFDNKLRFIEKECETAKSRIDEINNLIETRKKEVAKSLEELDIIFKKRVSDSGYSTSNWKSYLRGDEDEYKQRAAALTVESADLEDELSKLNEKITRLNTSKLAEIITRDNAKSVFALSTKDEIGDLIEYNDVKTNPYFNLLKYLIWNGYIDETYSDYMTYFYGNSLSSTDKNFLLSVTDKEAKEYTYELKSPKLVFENLRAVDFDEEETLNFSLLSYLLTNQINSDHLKRLIGQLKEKKEYNFVRQYYELNLHNKKFVVILNEQWPTFFAEMLGSPVFTKDVIKSYVINTLYHSNSDTVMAVNGENQCLTNYVSGDETFLAIDTPKVQKLIKAFKHLNIKFKDLDYSVSNKELFSAVYENNLYEFNYANIALMLKVVLGIKEGYEIIHQNYTIIFQNGASPLLSYVKDNFAFYIDLVTENCDEAIADSAYIVCEILNNEKLKKEQKQRYIELLVTEIKSLSSVKEKSYWSTLISHKCIAPTWENIFTYYSYIKKVNSELIDFINSNNEEFAKEVVKLFDETLSELAEAVVDCNELYNDKYATILVKSGVTFDTFDYQDISEDKISIIIENNIVNLNEETLDSFRENYPTLTLEFIRANLGKYLDIIDCNSFDYQEMLQILAWDVSNEDKIELIKNAEEPISIIGKNYSDAVAVYILKHNLEDNDIKILLETYDDSKTAVGNYVFSYAKSNIAEIVNHNMKISVKLRDDILSTPSVEPVEKATIIKHTVSDYEKDNLIVVLNAIGFEKVAEALIDNKQPRIPINEENALLLDAFKSRCWLSDYEENPNIPNCYKVIREKKSKKLASHLL